MVNVNDTEAQLVFHEGLKLYVYKDTEGNFTLGVGYNVSARTLDHFEQVIGREIEWCEDDYDPKDRTPIVTREECMKVLRSDIERVEKAVQLHFAIYNQLDPVRQRVAVDMAFNMGTKALGFRNAIAAVNERNWSRAARELYNSKWSRQVGDGPGGKRDRCDRLANMLLTGQAPTDIPAVI